MAFPGRTGERVIARQLAKMAIRKGAIQKLKELSPLLSLLKKRRLRTIVEIGTAKGGTLYAWCKVAQPDATIVSIDLPGGPFGGGYTLREMKTLRRFKGKKQRIHFLRKNSQKRATRQKLLRILKGRPIDFLVIDGDHRYAGVRTDWELYSPLVKKNGLIVFHDILFHPEVPECRVHRLWNEIKNRYRHKEFIDRGDDRGWGQWGGLGVLFNAGRSDVNTRPWRT